MIDILIDWIIIIGVIILNSIIWYYTGKHRGRREGFYMGRFMTLNYFLSKEKEEEK